MVVKNDARLTGLPQLNDFTHETVQRFTPGTLAARRKKQAKPVRQLAGKIWDVRDVLNGELWSDDRDFAIRSILEAPKTQGGYGIKVSDRDLKAAVVLAANENVFHPVKEYLTKHKWDGVSRAEQFFVTYLGAPDNHYTRMVSCLMLIAGVTRIFEPGHKFDFCVILEGTQGKGKSTLIQILGRNWFGELNGDFHDHKAMIELMQGKWIMEIPELSGFGRADVRQIKAFISTTEDRARMAYARRAGSFPRQCIFIGSTNDREYLKDDTGGRRFWPMPCTVDEIDTQALESNIDQIWAEAVVMYRAMRSAQPYGTLPLYLNQTSARVEAERLQESRRVESADDAMAGEITAWLDRPVSDGGLDDSAPARRDMTCLIQIWVECLGNDRRTYGQQASQALGRSMKLVKDWETTGSCAYFADPYGKQRFYSRIGVSTFNAKVSLKSH
jgi:predicted P-loop ATPase